MYEKTSEVIVQWVEMHVNQRKTYLLGASSLKGYFQNTSQASDNLWKSGSVMEMSGQICRARIFYVNILDNVKRNINVFAVAVHIE